MRLNLECIPCFARQVVEAVEMATPDPVLREQVIRAGLRRLAEIPFDKTPVHIGTEIHRGIRRQLESPDPYHDLKARTNRAALQLYPRLKEIVAGSPDGFAVAVRLAIAGNSIDFAYREVNSPLNLEEVIEDSLHRPLAIDDVAQLRAAVRGSSSILYLTDNAGEIVFDRVLIEAIPDFQERVTVAVRGEPVINDATLEDARQAGLVGLVRVIENGSDAPGTILDACNEAFRRTWRQADLVIAKGQGNYESLSDVDHQCFFLLRAKCHLVAGDLGVERGDVVVSRRDGGGG
jgi:hypothetical protein